MPYNSKRYHHDAYPNLLRESSAHGDYFTKRTNTKIPAHLRTPDLRGLCDHPQCKRYDLPDDTQRIALKRNGDMFYILYPGIERFSPIGIDRSLRYAFHSTVLGVTGKDLLQFALTVCLLLYPVSYAIKEHRAFAGKYLIDLPTCDKWTVEKTVPL